MKAIKKQLNRLYNTISYVLYGDKCLGNVRNNFGI